MSRTVGGLAARGPQAGGTGKGHLQGDRALAFDLFGRRGREVGHNQQCCSLGVIDIEGTGGSIRRYELHVDPDRLRHYGVTLRLLQNALAKSNANVGGDFLAQDQVALTVRAVGLFAGEWTLCRVCWG